MSIRISKRENTLYVTCDKPGCNNGFDVEGNTYSVDVNNHDAVSLMSEFGWWRENATTFQPEKHYCPQHKPKGLRN
jgi:hypothetical protein